MSFHHPLLIKNSRTRGIALSAALLALLAGCGTSQQPAKVAENQPAEGQTWQPTGEEGSITGKVNFQGEAPKYKALSMDADAVCAAKHQAPVYPEEVVKNANGTLRHVFVYVKSGLEGKSFAVPSQPVELDQEGCIYVPHVLGIQARQELKVVTSDKTTHNIHPMPKVNREANVSQPPGADPIMMNFSRPEVSIPVKCNQHAWMRAYIHVVGHPFYAVTGQEGAFEIKGLPPGNYQIEAVQEAYGAMTQPVTVGPKEAKTVEFTYRAKQAYRPSSLKMQPAILLPCCAE